VSNKPQAHALERARNASIPAVAFPWDRASQSREQYDDALLALVQREAPELVLLLGWMHVLADSFIAAFADTINIHPSFLPLDQNRDEVTFPDGTRTPAFRGAKAIEDALSHQCAWVGTSAHRVTLDADRGPVLVRKPLAVLPGEEIDALRARLHPLEHSVLRGGIMRWVFEQ
jgi:phosphoribosylglycinamide formyltransferase-1